MKSDTLFLALPVLATAINLTLAIFFLAHHAKGQEPMMGGRAVDRCLGVTGEECTNLDSYLLESQNDLLASHDDENFSIKDEEEDPMLRKMPGYDFKAYVRADVSTFYGEEPGSRQEVTPAYKGQAGKFINMSPYPVTLYWDGPDHPILTGDVQPWSSGGTACHPTHQFIFTTKGNPDDVICRFTVTPGTSVYYCNPFVDNDDSDPAHGHHYSDNGPLSLDSLSPDDREWYDSHILNLEFGAAYKNFTGGSEWLTHYPKDPPLHKIWRADYYGQEHRVTTRETHFMAVPPKENMRRLSMEEMREPDGHLSEYRQPGEMNMTIKALSCAPRAFEIQNFLSDVEVDHILNVIKTRHLERSTTAGHKSETRTSRTTWIPRATDPILNAVIRRAADALRMDEALLRRRSVEEAERYPHVLTDHPINEDLQIVHYDVGQQYTAHHDFGYPTAGQIGSPSRSINLCMYLNDVEEGGETSFPRWRNGETSDSLDVKPEKGKAMIFFMTNPDGNLDDLTQHAALPVKAGEKWFANLWIHDPYRT